MEYVLRFGICGKCSRANKTAVNRDGTAKCEQCADLTSVRTLNRRKPSRTDDRLELLAR